LLCFSCLENNKTIESTLSVVPYVDIAKYTGTWYEIARYPNRFQKDCFVTTAKYSIRDDGNIKVVNKCRKGSAEGQEKSVTGKAWVVDKKTNAKLKVQFFWPFRGDYWIIQLDKDYHYAVVSNPKRTRLWILSRTPEMDETTLNKILLKLKQQGFDPSKLIVI
jgi:apolipoprotein D and lipocalin family protein